MFLSTPKISNKEEKVYFSSDFTEKALYFFNNESIKLEIENIEYESIITESLIFEDTILLSEGNKDYLDAVIRYFVTSKKYIEDMWNRFSLDYSITQKESASLVGRAINGIEANGDYVYQGYRYLVRDENIHIDRVTTSVSELRNKIRFNQIDLQKGSTERMNKVRGKILGVSEIEADKFHSELLRHYRNGRTRQVDIAVTPSVKDEMLDTIFDSDRHLSHCVHLKNDILRFIDSVISHFKNIKMIINDNINNQLNKSGGSDAFKEKIKEIDVLKFATAEVNYYKKLLSIYTMILSTKLDIINERHRVYTRVIKQLMKQNQQDKNTDNRKEKRGEQ